MFKTDFTWSIAGTDYIIRNVPYEKLEEEGEKLFDLSTAIKMEMIRDLMVTGQIAREIDYDVIADFDGTQSDAD